MFSRFSKKSGGSENDSLRSRMKMVAQQIVARDVTNEAVLEAMRIVPRHLFVPNESRNLAYEDGPLSIGYGQTISQPYVVASMTENIAPGPDKIVLEIGTGSGYQTAVLAGLFKKVYTVEFIARLSKNARELLDSLDYRNIEFYVGDGLEIPKTPEEFDAIIVTAAPEKFPDSLVDRLGRGGKLIIPVGVHIQSLKLVSKNIRGQVSIKDMYPVRFVPLRRDD
ncbi:MAG: protein-L-isoaspartate(D-aspartate) O-methyltransferase [candidate division Zixibacteria bacterium]